MRAPETPPPPRPRPSPPTAPPGQLRGEADFFLVSVLSLYLEILLIRWIGTEIRIFAYFSNLVLVVCFFGLGLGYATHRGRLGLAHAAWTVALLLALAHPAAEPLGFRQISQDLAWSDVNTWTVPTTEAAARWLGLARLAVLLVLVALAFVPFGRVLGDWFSREPRRLRAYSVNVGGSIVGIWLFAGLSFARLPPWVWLAVAGLLFLVPLRRHPRPLAATGAAFAVSLALLASAAPRDGEVVWSSYQKLVVRELPSLGGEPMYSMEVNNTLYQYVLDLSDASLDRSPRPLPAEERRFFYYNLPYQLHPEPRDVLVVGAGAGNDVAAALRNGARRVDAVEIDAAIVDIGRRLHPEAPYDDPRVDVVVDDARAFFKRTERRYDLVVFGLLDSHKLTSNHSNINLDSYVYTVESFREARRLLRPGGALVVSFQTFYPYIAWRLHDVLAEATGEPPATFYVKPRRTLLEGTGGVVFFSGDAERLAALRRADPALDGALRGYARALPEHLRRSTGPEDVALSTDDWPYLYVASREVPRLWATIVVLVVVLAAAGIPVAGLPVRRLDGHFLFLGAAFLFLETHTITRAQLFFGTTWLVSSIVITAILGVILLGNLVVIRLGPQRLAPWYAGLLGAALLNWAVRPDDLLVLGAAGGAAVSAALAALPLLFAAVVFGSSFVRASDPRIALSSNLLGALVGGLVECASFVVGLRAIALFAVAFYVLSWILARRPSERLAAP